MSLTIDLDLNLLSEQMERYVRELGMDGPTVVRQQARLLLEQLIRLCPPHSLKEGRAAIARDVRNAIGQVNEKIIRMPALREALRSGDSAAVNAIFSQMKKSGLRTLHAVPFSKELHTGKRNARGRVRRGQGVLALTPAKARAYVKTVQARSGQAKGAFTPALHVVGGKAAGWIERHGGKYGDKADVALDAGEMDPRLTIINEARGIRALDDSDVSKTMRFRERAMKTNIAKLLELRAKQNNLT